MGRLLLGRERDTGRRLGPRLRLEPLLEELQQARAAAIDTTGNARGTLRVSVSNTFGRTTQRQPPSVWRRRVRRTRRARASMRCRAGCSQRSSNSFKMMRATTVKSVFIFDSIKCSINHRGPREHREEKRKVFSVNSVRVASGVKNYSYNCSSFSL